MWSLLMFFKNVAFIYLELMKTVKYELSLEAFCDIGTFIVLACSPFSYFCFSYMFLASLNLDISLVETLLHLDGSEKPQYSA